MNFTLQLKSNLPQAIAKIKARYPAAEARALNRAIVSARVVMAKAIAADMGLPNASVVKRMRMEEAAPGKSVAKLFANLKQVPLVEFKARGQNPSRGRGQGVTASMPGGRGRYPHAFMARMRSGHLGVFERVGPSTRLSPGAWSKNLPIKELKGASIGHVFTKYIPLGLARGQESLLKNLQSELRFAQSRPTA